MKKAVKLFQQLWPTAVVILAAGFYFGGPYKLTYKMKKGDNLTYKSNASVETTQERMGQEMQFSVETEATVNIFVEDVDKEGNLNLVQKISSMKLHLSSPMGDSTITDPDGIVGKRMRQILSPLGERLKSEPIDTLEVSGLLAQSGAAQQALLRFPKLPEEDLSVGTTWTTSEPDTNVTENMTTYVTPKTTFTVTGEVDTLGYHCLRFKYKGTIKIEGKGEQMGMQIAMDGDGTNDGVVYFAPGEGRMVAMTGNSEMDMTVAITGQMSMTIPSTTTTRMAVALMK